MCGEIKLACSDIFTVIDKLTDIQKEKLTYLAAGIAMSNEWANEKAVNKDDDSFTGSSD